MGRGRPVCGDSLLLPPHGLVQGDGRRASDADRDKSYPFSTNIRMSAPLEAVPEDVVEAPATYVHFWFILISVPNLLIIGGMVVLFALALVLPFPRHRSVTTPVQPTPPDGAPAPPPRL